MSFIVTRDGIEERPETPEFLDLEAFAESEGSGLALAIPNSIPVDTLATEFHRIAMIRIDFPAMGDGRGFSQARRLRTLGYEGRLRAAGPIVADQLRAAFRIGFDEIEVTESVAARQPASDWRVRPQGFYQNRVFA
jgi:uncharacterized protein (DUF934 family)